MFYPMLLFVLSNPQDNLNAVFIKDNRSILQTSLKKKKIEKIEKQIVLLIKMPLNMLEYKMQFLKRGNCIKFNKI